MNKLFQSIAGLAPSQLTLLANLRVFAIRCLAIVVIVALCMIIAMAIPNSMY